MLTQSLQYIYIKIIIFFFKLTVFCGLTNYYFDFKTKKFIVSPFLIIYNFLAGLSFIIFYIWSLLKILLIDYTNNNKGVTDFARDSTYIANYVICSVIYFSITPSKNAIQVYNKGLNLFEEINAFGKESKILNINFRWKILRCIIKTSTIVIGFLIINKVKYTFILAREMSYFDYILFFYLNIPCYIMALTSNRYYVVNTYFLCMTAKLNHQLDLINDNLRKHDIILKIKECDHQRKFYNRIANQLNHLN